MSASLVSFQPSTSFAQALERAAAQWGVEPDYWDIWGRRHFTSPEAKQAILESLGVSAGTRDGLDEALERRLWEDWTRLLPPALVLSSTSNSPAISIRIPEELKSSSAEIEVYWENGYTHRSRILLSELCDSARANLRNRAFVEKRAPLPEPLQLGYHTVRLSIGSNPGQPLTATTRLIVGPDRAWQPEGLSNGKRAAGIAISLYSLRSNRNWGSGDFTDLEAFTDWFSTELGGAFIALNPLHAIPNRQPYNTSPYLPNCIFFKNSLYIDVERIEDFPQSRRALRLINNPSIQDEINTLRNSEFVEYERVYALKLRFLKLLFAEFLFERGKCSERAGQFDEYIRQQGDLLDRYAVYCALEEYLHHTDPDIWIWQQWPEQYHDPESAATRAFAQKHWRSVLFYKYVQWQLDLQLASAQRHAKERGLPIGLYHDLALATDRCGSDFWAHRPFYVSGARVGSPPDDFSPDGQDWSFPPPNAGQHRENGYRLFTESIRRNSRHGGALRIDHVMRFFHLFWIPDRMTAARGAYVKDYSEDLLRILALESVRQQVIVIGEDLGTVSDTVRESLERFGILSYRLLYFEKDKKGQFRLPKEYPRRALVSVSTHDLPTLAGFWTGRDIEARHAADLLDEAGYRLQWADRALEKQKMLDLLTSLNLLPDWVPRQAGWIPELTGELHNAIVGFLVSTPSELMVLNQEDLFKQADQQNLPGSTAQYPNWRRKMRFTVEELSADREARGYTSMFRAWLERSGRRVQQGSAVLA